jgi:hypothetical protein
MCEMAIGLLPAQSVRLCSFKRKERNVDAFRISQTFKSQPMRTPVPVWNQAVWNQKLGHMPRPALGLSTFIMRHLSHASHAHPMLLSSSMVIPRQLKTRVFHILPSRTKQPAALTTACLRYFHSPPLPRLRSRSVIAPLKQQLPLRRPFAAMASATTFYDFKPLDSA